MRSSAHRRASVSFRFPRAYTSQLRAELLEDRTMPSAGLYYWADGERIELSPVTEDYAVRLSDGDTQTQLAQLTAPGGQFEGYEVEESVLPDVFVLERGEGDAAPGADATSVKWTTTALDRKSTRLNSSHLGISYAVFCLKK